MKGVITKVFPNGSAKASHSGNVDIFISPSSVIGRKNIAFLKEIYLGKLTRALQVRVMEMVSNPKVKTETIVKLILDYYKLICSDVTYKSVEKKFMSIKNPKDMQNLLESRDFHLVTILEPFVNVDFEDIKSAAKMLKVPLDEYVTIETPDGTKIKTDVAVPVGITYLQLMRNCNKIKNTIFFNYLIFDKFI